MSRDHRRSSAAARRQPALERLGSIDLVLLGLLAGLAAIAPLVVRWHVRATFFLALTAVAISTVASLAVWNAVASTVAGRDGRRMLPRAGASAAAPEPGKSK